MKWGLVTYVYCCPYAYVEPEIKSKKCPNKMSNQNQKYADIWNFRSDIDQKLWC